MVTALIYTWKGTPRDGAKYLLDTVTADSMSPVSRDLIRSMGIRSQGDDMVRELIARLHNAPYLWAEEG